MKIQRILVAIKSAERGVPLSAEHARLLAQRLDAELTLVSCVFDSMVAFNLGRGETSAIAAQAGMIQNARTMLETLAEPLRERGARVAAEVFWERLIYEGLLRAVRALHADLLVVGVHEPTAALHTRLTDTDWQLMRLCPCPLLVVKTPALSDYRTILAAVDPLPRHAEPTGLDRDVLATANEIGRTFGAELRVVHAFPDPASFAVASAVEVRPGVFYGAENIEAVHREAVHDLVSEFGVRADRTDVRPGDPADVIADVVREHRIQLVVLGALKRSALAQALLGSTTESVVASVESDVLLVPPTPPATTVARDVDSD